jgi:hypothetical protein
MAGSPVVGSGSGFGSLPDRFVPRGAELPRLTPIRQAYSTVAYGTRTTFARGGRHTLLNDLRVISHRGGDEYERQLATARVEGFLEETFADVEVADLPGSLAPIRRSDLWVPRQDYPTPLWDALAAGQTGPQRFSLPKFVSASGLAAKAVEKTEPAGGTFVDELVDVVPDEIWGKVEVSRQTLNGGDDVRTSTMIAAELIRSTYEAREAVAAAFLASLSADVTDITLTGTPASTPDNDDDQATVDDLVKALGDLLFARGGVAMRELVIHQALWRVLTRVKDDSSAYMFTPVNPDLTRPAGRAYTSIDIGGRSAVPAYALGTPGTAATSSWLFARGALRGWASAVQRTSWDFGATVQTANIPQLSFVTLGVSMDVAFAASDLASVREIVFDPSV